MMHFLLYGFSIFVFTVGVFIAGLFVGMRIEAAWWSDRSSRIGGGDALGRSGRAKGEQYNGAAKINGGRTAGGPVLRHS